MRDLRRPGLPREKVLAAVVRLLETTLHPRRQRGVRPRRTAPTGSRRCATATSRSQRPTMRFSFRGKSGKAHDVDVERPRAWRGSCSAARTCRARSSSSTSTTTGERQDVGSADVNDYLREIAGDGVHRQGLPHLGRHGRWPRWRCRSSTEIDDDAGARSAIVRAIETVAERLGNTPAVCRKCYVHPDVLDATSTATLVEALDAARARRRPRGPCAAAGGGRACSACSRQRLARGAPLSAERHSRLGGVSEPRRGRAGNPRSPA